MLRETRMKGTGSGASVRAGRQRVDLKALGELRRSREYTHHNKILCAQYEMQTRVCGCANKGDRLMFTTPNSPPRSDRRPNSRPTRGKCKAEHVIAKKSDNS